MKLSFLLSFLYIHIDASSAAVGVMLQCFPEPIISKFKEDLKVDLFVAELQWGAAVV